MKASFDITPPEIVLRDARVNASVVKKTFCNRRLPNDILIAVPMLEKICLN